MGAPAAADSGSEGLGNVGPSQPFQFVEFEIATSAKIRGDYVFTPTPVQSLVPIKNRSIYAFEVAEGEKPKLAAEFLADPNGALKRVSGDKRRRLELKAC